MRLTCCDVKGETIFSFEGDMSVQAIRREWKNLKRLEQILWDEKLVVMPRTEKWKQAQQITYWVNDLSRHIERLYKVANAKPKPKSDVVEFKGFVNYVLTEEDKIAYQSWEVDDHDLFLLVAGDNQTGYKLGTSFNAKNDTFQATYMCVDPTSANAGYILSAFAPDWYNALKTLCFKHNVILECVWDVEKVKVSNNWG